MGGIPRKVSTALASWARQLRADAQRDGWRWICLSNGLDEEQAAEYGAALVDQLVEAVTWVLATRFIDVAGTRGAAARACTFLADQAYGLPDVDRGTRYSLRFLGPLVHVEIFVRELSDVDLEDFESRFGLGAIAFRTLHGSLGVEEAGEIVQAVYDDLTFDGDEWEVEAELDDCRLLVEVREGEGGEE